MLVADREEAEDARSGEEGVEVAFDAGQGMATPAKTVGRLRRGGVAGEVEGAVGRQRATGREVGGARAWALPCARASVWRRVGSEGGEEWGWGSRVRGMERQAI